MKSCCRNSGTQRKKCQRSSEQRTYFKRKNRDKIERNKIGKTSQQLNDTGYRKQQKKNEKSLYLNFFFIFIKCCNTLSEKKILEPSV